MTFAETDKESSAIEGGLVWLQDSENVFVKGTILESLDNGQKVKVQPENSKDTLTINTEQLQRRNPPKFDNCDDMASLTYLNEPSVVYNLQQRYQNDSIYTYSGLFLVAVNPYKQLNIYNNQFIQLYKNSTVTQIENAEEKIEELETPSLSHPDSESTNNIDDNYEIPTRLSTVKPHIFAVAEEAFQNLVQTKSNQSILVTGESGAGKTENTKKVIQYIISVASSATNQSIAQTVEDRILQANPILEAFGNAQTVRNLNSSRFGKFVKINVNIANKELNGAKIEWYLLEKSRVVLQNSDERNYHIFYQFLRGAAEKDLDQFGLSKSLSQYNYLKFSNHTVPGMDDSKEYRTLIKALQIMDFSKQDIQNVFAVLAIILHLGNITFKNKPNDVKQAILDESVSKSIEMISKLFGIKEKDFKNSFLTSKVQAGREVVTQHRNASQAKFTIDALSKSLYERLFQYLVNKINYSFNTEANPMANTRYIGILDIAGFEIFKKNSFEQLCINYTNEKLQQFFNHHMFELEQSEYLKEGIKWDYIDFGQELKPTIDLIEGNKLNKKTGVFLILDEECVVPKGCDKSFLEKLHTQLEYKKSNKSNSNDKANNEKNIRYKPNKIRDGFIVKHYAGEVDYNVDGWLDKNKDPLSSTIIELLTDSSNLFISDLFSDSGALPQNVSDSPVKGGRTKKSGMFRTVAQRHREQLQQLMEQLHETHPHFVRCILPNTTKTAGKFDMQLVLEQLKCNGVLEGIRIARSGYPNRVEFKHFVEHYSILAKNQLSTKNSTRNFKQLAEIILGEMDLDADVYKVGLTKLFFRNGALANLEKKRDTKLARLLTNFQSHVRGKLVRDEMNSLMAKMRASDLINKNFQAYSKLSKDPWFVLCSKLKPMLINSNENQTKSIQKLKSLENEIRALKTEKEEYLKLQAETSSELAKFKSEMEADNELMQKKDKELGETKKSLVKLESEIQKAKSSKTELEEINSGLKSTIETLESEKIETSKNISDELSKEKEELQDKLKSLENEIKNFETAKTANDKLSGKLNEEISMLKKQVDQKNKQISEMKSKSFETDNLKDSLEKTNFELKSTKKKLDDIVAEKAKLATKLNEAELSSREYTKSLKEKTTELSELQKNMKKDQERVNNFFKLKEGLETREKEIDDEVAKYTSEIEKLKSKNKQLKTQAKETKNLLDSKISAEIKFNQERTDYEETIKSLREDIENLTQELKLEQTSHSNINKKIAKLKTEKEALVKAKKESDVEAAKLNMKLSTRGPQPSSTPIASSYIFSSESSTELARLRERLESVELKYASEQYENRRLKAYIINNGGSEDIISSLSPFRTPKRPVSIGSPIALSFTGSTPSSGSRSSELESERTVNAKLQNKLVELQAELARVKGSQRSSIGSGSAYSVTNSEESDDFKTKFRMSQVQVKNLEERLKNISRQQRLPSSSSNLSLSKFNETREFGTNISNTVNYNTDPFVSDDKKVLETRQENLRLSSQLNEAQTKLRRLQSTSDSSFIQREKIAKLEAKIQSLETIIKNQVNEIKLYKGRSDTYIDNMEESHIAVTSAKRAEEALKIELSNAKNRLSKYQGDLKKSDVKVATLNKKIQELEGDLSDSRFELRCAQEEYERLKEKYENQEELKSSASIQTTKLQDKEIEMLSKSLTEHINKEADLRKQIKSVLLQLDISKKECTASKNTNSELMKEKRLNDKIFSETIQKNEDLLTLQQEHIMKLNTLASQVNSLKTANGNLFAERDSLLRAKRDLEAKIEIINQDFEKHLAKAKEDANNAVTVVTLTNQLKEERANFAELKDELSDYEKKLKTAEEDMAKLNKESLMIIEENKALTKFNEQSNAQVRELKTQLEDMANTENAHWSERVQKLEKDLFLLNATKRNKDHKLEQLERSVRDLEHTTEGQKNTIERYENEIKSLEETINRLNDNLNEMTEREATALLNEKKAARELQQQKEQSLLLEKELLDMRLQPV